MHVWLFWIAKVMILLKKQKNKNNTINVLFVYELIKLTLFV